MRHHAIRLSTLLLLITTALFSQESIRGTCTIRISSPITPELSAKARILARADLKAPLLEWLQENRFSTWDTTNLIHRIHLDTFAGLCLAGIVPTNHFNGPQWSTIYLVPPDKITTAIEEHNRRCDTLAQRAWTQFQSAVAGEETARMYVTGIRTIFYADGHIGPPLHDRNNDSTHVANGARSALGAVMKKLRIGGPALIVAGKPGTRTPAGFYVEVKLDTLPVPGLKVAFVLPGGKRIFSGQSDINGRVSLENLHIPYVNNGTQCYIRPDIGRLIDTSYVFTATDLAIPGYTDPDQSLLFKINRPTTLLTYKALAVNSIQLPKDFAENPRFIKFLSDSCALDAQVSVQNPDLKIEITSQISSYYFDNSEDSTLKAEALIRIEEGTNDLKRIRSETWTYEKGYGHEQKMPVGLFLWEVSGKLTKTIKSILGEW